MSKRSVLYSMNSRLLYIIFFVFALVVSVITAALFICMLVLGEEKVLSFFVSPVVATILLLVATLIMGTILVSFAIRSYLKPLHAMHDAMEKVSKGDLTARVSSSASTVEMEQLMTHFNSMVTELGKIESLKNDFITTVSHEFKTPLSAIQGYSGLLSDPSLSEEERSSCIANIQVATERLASLTANVLSLNKLENTQKVQLSRVPLGESLRLAILQLQPKWQAKEMELDIDVIDIDIETDSRLIDTVWSNLLDNAIKYSNHGGVLHISLAKRDAYVVAAIRDEGIGISEEDSKHIFDKFFQADASRASQGNGLGLSLVKRIVDLLEGSIAVKSTEGVGTSVEVWLPLRESTSE